MQKQIYDFLANLLPEEAMCDRVVALRFLEEAIELCQTFDVSYNDVSAVTKHVLSRPVGERQQEVGGVMMTLSFLCEHCGIDLNECSTTELERLFLIDKDRFKARQQEKLKAGLI